MSVAKPSKPALRPSFVALGVFCAALGLSPAPASRAQEAASPATEPAATPERPAPLRIERANGPITVDGVLDDAAWQGAVTTDRFYDTNPGDNAAAPVRTVARFTYDDRYFYIGIEAYDPDISALRAPFVDRDQVLGTGDNVAVFLDTRNDRRSAVELRVSPRGLQADAVFNDANYNEDFSPDFFYDTAAKINADGWTAEFRVPFSSLRYPDTDPQSWGVLVWRNYPRDYRYFLHSAPVPRGSNCLICHAHELTGFENLPTSRHLVVAPYTTAQVASNRNPEAGGSNWEDEDGEFEAGLDLKWNPTPSTTIDLTLNPDFSQIESDEAQIQANERFALFVPEKRPFFLEGVDLFDSPIQAVYTRTITAPRWGLRATGKTGSSSYSLLVTEDRGGGLVVLPRPTSSDFALQNFESTVAIGRLRRDFGASFGGLLFTAREIDGGGHNMVFGPDVQWRWNETDTLRAQVLFSDTEDPDLPGAGFEGLNESAMAAFLSFNRATRTQEWQLRYRDTEEGFRADNGFVTASGYRDLRGFYGRSFYPQDNAWLRWVRPYAGIERSRSRSSGSQDLGGIVFTGVSFQGRMNLNGGLEAYRQEVRVGSRLLEQTQAFLWSQIDPSRRIKRLGFDATLGEAIDFENGREADGATLGFSATLNPTDHLEVQLNARRRTLDVEGGRLLTARVERMRANYVFSARQLLRLVVQHQETRRQSGLYDFPVDARTGGLDGSLLYSFKLNWQTVLFLGIGDQRLLTATPREELEPVRRSVFFKVSYALQR